MIEIREYIDIDGRCPFARWFRGLDARAAAKAATSILRLEHGNHSNTKGVGEGVQEIRISFGPGYRIYFGWDGPALVILLGGGDKRRQQRDIERAKQNWRDYRTRKKQGS